VLLTIRIEGKADGVLNTLFRGEAQMAEEFWFGRGFAWMNETARGIDLKYSLLLDVPQIVARTKRRDRAERFAVGFCDPYTYSGWGLMGLFLARFGQIPALRRGVEIELVSYPERPHSEEIAKRLFLPLGYSVSTADGRLKLRGERIFRVALSELPALLLALDRKARLFLSSEELHEIRGRNDSWIAAHPAKRAIELALQGKPTALRLLLPPAAEGRFDSKERKETDTQLFIDGPIQTSLVPSISLASVQQAHALEMSAKMDIDPRWLVYLPAAVASVQSSSPADELEDPRAALAYYAGEQIEKAVVEQKHMGSRAIVVLCRTSKIALERFGVDAEIPGSVYTRNGRRFFRDSDTEAGFSSGSKQRSMEHIFGSTSPAIGSVSTVRFFHGQSRRPSLLRSRIW
jgi:hypothetical protein